VVWVGMHALSVLKEGDAHAAAAAAAQAAAARSQFVYFEVLVV